jgi:HSP20 family molecular chaperone IbpA
MTEKRVVRRGESAEELQTLLPRVDVFENKDGILLLADMPGVPKDKLELRVENDTLLIEGEIAPDTPENMEPVYAEVRLSRYRRAFSLSAELDTSRIDAQLRDGVLNLRIPKHAHAQPRKIEVKVA